MYAREESQWAVVDWLSEYLGLDLIPLWENRADAPCKDTATGAMAYDWLDNSGWPDMLFGERWDVWSYGDSHGIGEGRFVDLSINVLRQLLEIWGIDIPWADVAGSLPNSQQRVVDDFLAVYRSCVIWLGGGNWATFNGLFFASEGGTTEDTGLKAVLDRTKAHVLSLMIARGLAEEWVELRTRMLIDGGTNQRAAAETARQPFVKFFKLLDGCGDDRFEGGLLRMIQRRSMSSDGMNGAAAQGTLTLLNGHFYLDEGGVRWTSQRGSELADLKNSRVVPLTWPGPDGPVTEEYLYNIWHKSEWATFLANSIPVEAHRIRLAMAVGDSLFGAQKAKMITMVIGQKDSGKSLLLELLADVLGDYAAAMPEEMMMSSRRGTNDKFVLEPVRGRRFGTVSEGEEGQTLNAVVLKRLTGRDSISSRDLNKSYSTFRPEISLFLGTNEEPGSLAQDQALGERLLRVNTALRPGVVKDPSLPNRLRAGDGMMVVLAWALWGAVSRECMAALEGFRAIGAAAEGVAGVMSGGDTRVTAMIECIRSGMLRAVGTETDWEDWRRLIESDKDRSILAGAGEHVGGAVGIGAARWLQEEGLLRERAKRGPDNLPGATMDEVIHVLQAFVADPSNREKFQRSGDRVLWGTPRALRTILAMYFGGTRKSGDGLRLMGIEVYRPTSTGRF
jgi:hypothetical protein